MLAALTVRRPAEATLDLGTGSGVQAFLAARHSEHVVGTDVSARALRLARLNAALNGVENVEWRQGDLFEPVRDERFGLVVANPPFVVSPVHEVMYRDGGLDGDGFSREALTGAARRLHEGGFATVLCGWITEPGAERLATPRRWLEGSGCDAWVLELANEGPVTYAMLWNDLPGRRPEATAKAAEPWLADYRARGIEAISTGAIVLRKRSGRNWVRFDELAVAPRGEAERPHRAGLRRPGLPPVAPRRGRAAGRDTRACAGGACSSSGGMPGGALERARLTVEEGIPLRRASPRLGGSRPRRARRTAAARRDRRARRRGQKRSRRCASSSPAACSLPAR